MSSAASNNGAQATLVGSPAGRIVLLDGPVLPEATLMVYRDRGNTPVFGLWATVMPGTVTAFAEAGTRCDPVWPAPYTNSGQSFWHPNRIGNLDEVVGAVRLPGNAVATFSKRGNQARVFITNTNAQQPSDLLDSLVKAELTSGPMTVEEIERQWLLRNVGALGRNAPADTPVDELRRGLASLLGYSTMEQFQTSPSYQPFPSSRQTGWLRWARAAPTDMSLLAPIRRSALVHLISPRARPGANIADVFTSGYLLSRERRAAAGVALDADAERPVSDPTVLDMVPLSLTQNWADTSPPSLVWENPLALLARLDSLSMFVNPVRKGDPWKGWQNHATSNLSYLAQHISDVTEAVVHGGIDLLGDEAPSRVIVRNDEERRMTLDALHARGITHLGKRTIQQVVVVRRQVHEAVFTR